MTKQHFNMQPTGSQGGKQTSKIHTKIFIPTVMVAAASRAVRMSSSSGGSSGSESSSRFLDRRNVRRTSMNVHFSGTALMAKLHTVL